ncbi:autotransporter assembly complex protein TamA [Roseovarius ramblicola]|uniref:Autotransporter assembly complex family protein n=1 Tax=Roseovarius ramblicola TaxID=2022336 RepID=A0ABV5HYQ6_9RHOB
MLAWLAPLPVRAAEVRLSAPRAPEAFTERLRAASLSVSTAGQADSTVQDLLAAARADYARLVGVLYAEGFYGGKVSVRIDGREAADIPPLSAPDAIDRIAIEVVRGAAFRFGDAEVTPLAPGTGLPGKFLPGALARAGLVREATQTGIEGWRAAGHAKARVAAEDIVANHPRALLDARITLDPGPRLRFGDLRLIEGDRPSRVRAARISEIAGLPTGRVYSPEEVEDAANRLRRSGAFRSVRLTEAEVPAADGTLDIEAQVSDAKRRRVGAGAELASLEGVTLSGFWLHRNLLGGAERLRIDAMIGGIGGQSGGEDVRLGARLDRPATFTPDTGAFLLADIEDRNEPDYSERKAEIGGGLTHVFSDTLTAEAGITYRYSEIDDDLGKRKLQHLLLPLRATWDRRDDPLNPREGRYLEVALTPFAGLDQGGGGARLYADLRDYLTLGGSDRLTLAGRAQIGSVAGANREDVPADMLFYSGGAGTVRGQDYQTLGVDLGPGITVGGRSFMGVSGEVRAMINDNVQAVAFADGGYIGKEALGVGTGEWHGGAGLGARYFTAVGPIRVDLATPLDSGAGKEFEIYIGIGQAF